MVSGVLGAIEGLIMQGRGPAGRVAVGAVPLAGSNLVCSHFTVRVVPCSIARM